MCVSHGSPLSACILAAALLSLSCSQASPPAGPGPKPDPEPETRRYCPLPLTWRQGEPRPVRIQVHNRTELELSVWLDNCDGHLRLGDLPPGIHRSLRLPTLLIPFNNQLHFHTFDHEGDVRFASYAVDLAADWTLTLDINESTPQLSLVFGPESTPLDRYIGLDAFMTYPGETISYASRLAERSPAVLTWQCVNEERQITLSTGRRLTDEVGGS